MELQNKNGCFQTGRHSPAPKLKPLADVGIGPPPRYNPVSS